MSRIKGFRKTKEEFIEDAEKIYGKKYDYSKVDYVNTNTPVIIKCLRHNYEFTKTPENFLHGYGCPICGRENLKYKSIMSTEDFIKRARKIHGDKYDYSKVDMYHRDANGKVCIICPDHGAFWVLPSAHLQGERCPKCYQERFDKEILGNNFIKKARKIHGDRFDYSQVEYVDANTPVKIICHEKDKFGNEYGEFFTTPHNHLHSAFGGCKKLRYSKIAKKRTLSQEEFIKRAKEIHGNKYDYSNIHYFNMFDYVYPICPKHGPFAVTPVNHLTNKSGCPKCSYSVSRWEKEIYHFLTDNGIRCEESNRSILKNQEIDIYLPDYGIGIECDGLHWHSEKFRDKNYHLHKTVLAHMNGIRLIHIFEDEWMYKQDILKSMLMNMLGKTNHKIYARKCQIMEVNGSERKAFLNGNHVQGDCISSVNLGLYYKGDLVSLMTFGKPRINVGSGIQEDGSWELIRFCSKLNTDVIGAASKLFKYFLKAYNPVKVTTYSDKRWSLGRMYEILGFSHDHDSSPNYFYIVGNHRENRFRYRKSVLVKEGYDSNKTEHEIMMEREIYRIYDCGTKVWIWDK